MRGVQTEEVFAVMVRAKGSDDPWQILTGSGRPCVYTQLSTARSTRTQKVNAKYNQHFEFKIQSARGWVDVE